MKNMQKVDFLYGYVPNVTARVLVYLLIIAVTYLIIKKYMLDEATFISGVPILNTNKVPNLGMPRDGMIIQNNAGEIDQSLIAELPVNVDRTKETFSGVEKHFGDKVYDSIVNPPYGNGFQNEKYTEQMDNLWKEHNDHGGYGFNRNANMNENFFNKTRTNVPLEHKNYNAGTTIGMPNSPYKGLGYKNRIGIKINNQKGVPHQNPDSTVLVAQ